MKCRQCQYLWGLRRFFLEKENKKSKKVEKSFKKVFTMQNTHDIISELRREIQHRTLTNKQQCNPENSK